MSDERGCGGEPQGAAFSFSVNCYQLIGSDDSPEVPPSCRKRGTSSFARLRRDKTARKAEGSRLRQAAFAKATGEASTTARQGGRRSENARIFAYRSLAHKKAYAARLRIDF